eukprot:jgi/Orpsp1_1/1176545/evm.model.c7180000058021.1
MNYIRYILFIVFYLFITVYSVTVTINDEEELLNAINKNKSATELEIKINNNSIDIVNGIIIENDIKKLTIKGTSKNSSILKFNDYDVGFLFNTIPEVNISHLTIHGNLHFIKNRNIVIEDVNLFGALNIDKTFDQNIYESLNSQDKYYTYYAENLDLEVKIKEFNYNVLGKNEKENCINLYGNVVIEDSQFYGSSLCQNSLVSYNGEELNAITITNTKFNGASANNCLSINNAKNSLIQSSQFENGFASQIG